MGFWANRITEIAIALLAYGIVNVIANALNIKIMGVTFIMYITLDTILNKDAVELQQLAQGEYEAARLGTIAYTEITQAEYKQCKKDCITMTPDGTGGMTPEIDDDKMMVRVIITAVGKDPRSDFTFANKDLLAKLDVISADAAVAKLLKPGEIFKLAIAIQTLSGFGAEKKKEVADEVKNS